MSDLNDERLGEIIRIFDEVYGGGAQTYLDGLSPTFLIRDFYHDKEWAFSSKFSSRTKLFISAEGHDNGHTVVGFKSNPNADSRDESQMQQMEQAELGFKKAVSDYLETSGVGIRLHPYF